MYHAYVFFNITRYHGYLTMVVKVAPYYEFHLPTLMRLCYLEICRIEPSLGKVKSLTADSCKHIREVLATDCSNLPNSGIYWVWKEKPMQVSA